MNFFDCIFFSNGGYYGYSGYGAIGSYGNYLGNGYNNGGSAGWSGPVRGYPLYPQPVQQQPIIVIKQERYCNISCTCGCNK